MDLLIKELDQLRLYCSDSLPAFTEGVSSFSVFELADFFRWLNRQEDFDRVLDGVGWLLANARSGPLRAQIDTVLDAVLGGGDETQAWRLACLFATGKRDQKRWCWDRLLDAERVLYCLQQAAGHSEAEAYLHFLRKRKTPEQLVPSAYSSLTLVLEAVVVVMPYRPQPMLRLLERLVRCGSLSAWELLQQHAIEYRQVAVLERWLEAMRAQPFPFAIRGECVANRTQLLRWSLLRSPAQISNSYGELDRRQWFALLQLLNPPTRNAVAELTWRHFGAQLRL